MKKIIFTILVLLMILKVSYAQYTDNYAASFNGSNSYVSTRNSTDLSPTTAITIEAWIFPTSLPTNWAAIVGKNYVSSYFFGIENTGGLIFYPKGFGAFLRSKGTSTIRLNQWTHVAATYDGTNTRIYIDGVLDTSTTAIGGLIGSNTDSLFIGCEQFLNTPAFFFNGKLDNVRIWSIARTSAQIASHRFIPLEMLGSFNIPYNTLKASYQFDNDAMDNSGNIQEHGNARNITYSDYTNKAVNYLDYNNSLVLNGTTDYARRGNYNSVYDPTINITLEAWIKRDTTGTQPAVQNIINKSGGTTRYNYALVVYPTGELNFAINSGTHVIQSAPVVTNAQWTHVAATYTKSTGKAVIYVNGDTVVTGIFASLPTIASDADSTFLGGIGATAYSANKFKGSIDGVRIWYKAARTQAQIKEYMHKHYIATTTDSLMSIDFDRFQNSFKLGYGYFLGSLMLRGNATISSAHNISDDRRSSPMLPEELQTSSYTSSFKRFFVPDNYNLGISDSVFISGGAPVNNLKMFIMMSHSFTQDIVLNLTSPFGMTISILVNRGGSGNDVMTIFSDEADSLPATGTSVNGPGIISAFSPSIKPDNSLSQFNGQNPAGWWKLKIFDLAGTNIGYVHAWGINLISKKILNVSALIQGFYDSTTNKMVPDTAQMFFRIPLPPYPIVDSAKAVLDSNGNANFYFNKVNNGYRVFKHRNSIETWTPTPVTFTGDSSASNFTTSSTQAYGNNLKQVDTSPLRFAIYNGDPNQDGVIDVSDVVEIYNDVIAGTTGYVRTDIDGNNFVDVTDLIITNNNLLNLVGKVTP